MKIFDINKYKMELMEKLSIDFKNWMSPTIRDYYSLFIKKASANKKQILSWAKEYSILENGERVNVSQKPVQLPHDASILFETLQKQIGETVHVGSWFTITQERIDQFSDTTEDHQWLHNDTERAKKESPFKTTIAHGFLTLSLLPKLTDSVDPGNKIYPEAKMIVNYGLNQVRFPYPIKSGSVIRAHSRLIKATPITRGIEIEKEISIEIKNTRRPGCVVVSIVRIYF